MTTPATTTRPRTAGEPVIRTDGLGKTFGDRRTGRAAVQGLTMTVRRGEVYGFLGPNGAGKTTTMRMLVGLVRPTAGTATVLGRTPGSPELAGSVGSLIEGPGFAPHLSGRDNLRVLARHRGLPDAAVEPVLERVDLAGRSRDRFRSYSLGMKQRLGVAAALLGDPELLVLDEPTNGLDPAGMADMRRLVADLARGGQTVLLSSHLLSEVQELSDRVGVIAGGRLLRESTVSELRGDAMLRLRARPVAAALAAARALAPGARLHGDLVELDLPADGAPALVRELVRQGIEVFEVTRQTRSLEDVFMELTAAEPSQAAPTHQQEA